MTTATETRRCPHGHAMTRDNVYTRPDGGRECRQCKRDRNATTNASRRGHVVKYGFGYHKYEPVPEEHPEPQTGWKRYILGPLEAKLRGEPAVKLVVAAFRRNMGHAPTVVLCSATNVCQMEGLIVRVANPAMGEPKPVGDLEFDLR